MTDDRSLDRAARSWLELGPTEAPDHAVEAALLRIQTTAQERDWHVPWRNRPMTMTARLVAAAIAIAVVAVGGVMILRPGGPTVGGQATPPPSASVRPSPSPTPSGSLARAAAPATTLGDWQAVSDAAIPGLFAANDHIQLSIDWQAGRTTWIQTSSGQLVLKSETLAAPANEIDLVTSSDAESVGCTSGQVGRYTWSRSADGLFLTLTAIADACANRQTAMSRTWVHSLSAVTDGQTGVLPFSGWLKMTLPKQRF